MAKVTKAKAAAPQQTGGKQVKRDRRNSFERKCLPKAYKRLFAGESRTVFKGLLSAWQETRKRVSVKDE
jgi:hypothetical protein